MKPNPVVWFEIYVQDMKRAQAFYEAVLACKLQDLPAPEGEASAMQMKVFPSQGEQTMGATGTLVKMDGFSPSVGGTLVYFACEDCATEQGRVEAAGGKVFKPKFAIGEHGFCALVNDTEGNLIGLHSMK